MIRTNRMRLLKALLFALSYFIALANYASTLPAQNSGIHLDQTRGVVFEQFLSYTYSLQLLQAKTQFHDYDLLIGGSLQSDLQRWQGDTIAVTPPEAYRQGSAFYFTQITADLMGNLSPWMTAFASVADSHALRGGNDSNYIYLPNVFLLLGNLDKTPFYATIGISNIPFGVFQGCGSWDVPLTSDYFNLAQAPAISVGFFKNGLNLIATGFSDTTYHNNNFAYSLYYTKNSDSLSYSLGTGYVTNIKTNSTGNANVHKTRSSLLPAFDMGQVLDFNASLNYYQFGVTAEFARGNRLVAMNNGIPSAFAITANYTPKIGGRDTSFGISHSISNHLNDIGTAVVGENAMPAAISGLKNAWALSVTRPVFSELVIFGLDLERSLTYSEKHSYTGTIDLMLYL